MNKIAYLKSLRSWIDKIFHVIRRFFSSPVKTFILLASVFGIAITIIAPPLTGADEEAHFVRAYGISEGDFRLFDTRLVEIPKSYRETIGCFQFKDPKPGKIYKYRYEQYGIDKKKSFSCALGLQLNRTNTEKVHTTAPAYSPTTYIPQVFVIAIAKVFNLPIVIMVYLTRLAVLAAFIALIALAIKIVPVRKWALVGVALLPYSIIHITNPGGDYMLFGLAAVFTAVIIRSVYLSKQDLRKESTKLLLVLGVVAALIVLPKGIFPGICFLPLLLFFGGLKHEVYKKIIILLAAAAIGFLWQKFGTSFVFNHANEVANSIGDFPYAFLKTMFYRWVDTDFIYRGDYVGNIPIPGNHIGMPSIIITVMGVLLAVYLFVGYPEKAKLTISKFQAILLRYSGLLIAIGVVVGSFAAIFIAASNLQDGSFAIRGVQPRYFYIAFFMLALIPFVRSFRAKTEKNYARLVIIGSLVLLSAQVLVLAIKFHWDIF